MGLPGKINAVDIIVKQASITNTIIDDDFREPVSTITYGTEVLLRGQANFGYPKGSVGMLDQTDRRRTGDAKKSFAHLVFRTSDLEEAGFSFNTGDIVTSIAGISMDLEVEEVRYESPLNERFLLTYVVVRRRHDKRATE